MYNASTPVFSRYSPIAAAMDSGPLSLRMCFGTPRVMKRFSKMSSTLSAVMLRSTSRAKHSRVYSSVISSHFSGRPAVVRSWMKSHVQTWSLCSALRRDVPLSLDVLDRLQVAVLEVQDFHPAFTLDPEPASTTPRLFSPCVLLQFLATLPMPATTSEDQEPNASRQFSYCPSDESTST